MEGMRVRAYTLAPTAKASGKYLGEVGGGPLAVEHDGLRLAKRRPVFYAAREAADPDDPRALIRAHGGEAHVELAVQERDVVGVGDRMISSSLLAALNLD